MVRIALYGLLLALCAITLFPMYYVLVSSFSDPVTGLQAVLWPIDFYATNYLKVFQTDGIWKAYLVTIGRVLTTAPVFLVLISMTAFVLTRKFQGRRIVWLYLMVPMFIGGGLVPTYMLYRNMGLLNTYWVLVLPNLFGVWPTIVMMTTMRGLPEGIVESATIDGATLPQIFRLIIMPLVVPTMVTLGLFHAVGIWNDWFSGSVYLTNKDLYPLQTFLQIEVVKGAAAARFWDMYGTPEEYMMSPKKMRDLQALTPRSLESAYIIISVVPIIAVYPFLQRYFIRGVLVGSIKG